MRNLKEIPVNIQLTLANRVLSSIALSKTISFSLRISDPHAYAGSNRTGVDFSRHCAPCSSDSSINFFSSVG